MNTESDCDSSLKCCAGITGWAIGIVGTFLLVAALVAVMYFYTRPAPLAQNRIEERKKNLAELRASDKDSLETYGWVDQTKGIVRLPISAAIELTLKEYSDPVAGKTNLVARSAKASFVPPPPPAAPNPFE